MNRTLRLLVAALSLAPLTLAAGEKQLFNGKDLTGWQGNPALWSVEDGAITGRSTADHPLKHNTFLVWQGGTVGDFELTFHYRIERGNSGLQYRSKLLDPGESGPIVGGYQADIEAGKNYTGILYEERGRGILAQRGQQVAIKPDPANPAKPQLEVAAAPLGNAAEIQAAIKHEDWNEFRIVAKGNRLQHFVNGRQTVDVTDQHAAAAAKEGILALQLHAGPPMVIQVKDLKLTTGE